MNTPTRTQIAFILLLLTAGFTLAACSTGQAAGNPAPAEAAAGEVIQSGQPANTQGSQANTVADTADWNAATFYSSTCAACHGPQGEGSPIAPALTSETVQTAERDWVIETISKGRPDTAMPAWSVEYGGPLYSEQVEAMADFVQAEGWQNVPVAQIEAGGVTAVSAPAEVSPEAINLFATTCSGCHGANGQGSNIAPPLNSPELRARLDDAALAATITNGRPGTQMPAWGNTLSPAEIDSLVTLIRNWDSLNNDQLAQMAEQAAECGPPMGMGMMGMGRGMGGGMMGGGGMMARRGC